MTQHAAYELCKKLEGLIEFDDPDLQDGLALVVAAFNFNSYPKEYAGDKTTFRKFDFQATYVLPSLGATRAIAGEYCARNRPMKAWIAGTPCVGRIIASQVGVQCSYIDVEFKVEENPL